MTPRLKNSQGEEESGGGDSEYGCTRGTYLDSCIVFSESTLLCFNKCLDDYPTSLSSHRTQMMMMMMIVIMMMIASYTDDDDCHHDDHHIVHG